MPVPLACWLLIRPALFTLYAIVTYLIGMFDGMDSTPDTFLALMPMIALLLFGTHLDILHAWMFWRRRKSEEEPNENPVEKMPATEMTEVIVIDAASSRIVTYP
ncbi:hypothetical protein PUNSTDRAFT_138981 [Punctularia strigosozonata HHB-11173 SS5]|uniref:Uncharacterized protein n=1 Tax=Punctularia strigosozonata (strain HHB-11173) TaxID=741275 RepID=R7S2C9_PUNST|nr:uncharacterized protein PUNSTDRAFT_138981 [Punctularia strigosozonata HHB-11173 SS5]EIN03937.1 hypothetical protein PUNSTDRAFT_138981 [Punctularia strigosozonata HHB-11173 SS5]